MPHFFKFQTRTGFPGHLARTRHLDVGSRLKSFKPERASQAI